MKQDAKDELICDAIGLLIVFFVAWLVTENVDAVRALLSRYGVLAR